MSVLLPVTAEAQLAALGQLPVIAVDMGFSGRTASCGYAIRANANDPVESENKRFHDCLAAVVKQFANLGEAILILEAPLSSAFDRLGNPQPRGDFERHPKPRWWSLGPGASMSLAAMYFLKRFVEAVPAHTKCHLIEGFVVGADSGHDADVAEALIDSFAGVQRCAWQAPAAPQLMSVIDWVIPGASGQASPIVLIPKFS
jgi:hypothetical protein